MALVRTTSSDRDRYSLVHSKMEISGYHDFMSISDKFLFMSVTRFSPQEKRYRPDGSYYLWKDRLGFSFLIWDIEKKSFMNGAFEGFRIHASWPVGDNRHFLTIYADPDISNDANKMSIWDIYNLKEPVKTFPYHANERTGDSCRYALAMLNDHRHFVSFQHRGLHLWDIRTAESGPIAIFGFNEIDYYQTGLLALPDGKHFIGGAIRGEDIAKKADVHAVLVQGTKKEIVTPRFSAGEELSDQLAIWSIHHPKEPVKFLELPACYDVGLATGYKQRGVTFTLLKDNKHLLGDCTYSKNILLWDLSNLSSIKARFQKPQLAGYLIGDLIELSNEYFASNTAHGGFWLWDMLNPSESPKRLFTPDELYGVYYAHHLFLNPQGDLYDVDRNGKVVQILNRELFLARSMRRELPAPNDSTANNTSCEKKLGLPQKKDLSLVAIEEKIEALPNNSADTFLNLAWDAFTSGVFVAFATEFTHDTLTRIAAKQKWSPEALLIVRQTLQCMFQFYTGSWASVIASSLGRNLAPYLPFVRRYPEQFALACGLSTKVAANLSITGAARVVTTVASGIAGSKLGQFGFWAVKRVAQRMRGISEDPVYTMKKR